MWRAEGKMGLPLSISSRPFSSSHSNQGETRVVELHLPQDLAQTYQVAPEAQTTRKEHFHFTKESSIEN